MNIQYLIFGIILGIIIGIIIFTATQEKFIKTEISPSTYFGGDFNNSNIKVIKEDNIRKIIIPLKEGDTIGFGEAMPTKSMYQTISDDTITINLLNITENDLYIGDIISIDGKKVDFVNDSNDLIHRIIDIKEINGTTYYKTQGDNNENPDPEWWKFEDVRSKIIGVLY